LGTASRFIGAKLLLIECFDMDNTLIIELVFQAMRMAGVLAGPSILALLITGLVIGILQAATSINETTVAFVPKLLVFAIVLLMIGPVSLALYTDYIRELFARIPSLIS
jgi:flagellar biosynthetic protein FliQ